MNFETRQQQRQARQQWNDPAPIYIMDGGRIRQLAQAQAQEMERLLTTRTANRKEA